MDSTLRGAVAEALPHRSVADEAFYEWLLSDHPLAAAERERRRREHYLRRHEQRALIRQLVDHWTPEASQRLFALRESMGRFADRWERVCDEWQQGESVDVGAVRARLTLQRRDRGDAGYRYPPRYLGPGAAQCPPPLAPELSEAAVGAEEPAGSVCVRLGQTADGEFLFERFGVPAEPLEPRAPVAPAQALLVVDGTEAGRMVREMRWGLPSVPAAGTDPSRRRLTEAAAETALDDPVLAAPLRGQRVIVPVGWVEARGRGGQQPLRLRRDDRDVLCLAGVWDRRPDPVSGEETAGVTILTVEADAGMRRRGDRMPLALDPEEEEPWLDGVLDAGGLSAILGRPRSSAELSVSAAGEALADPSREGSLAHAS
jgi:putative SOS response-associated peptidase YedK